jgi:hypothetical protein
MLSDRVRNPEKKKISNDDSSIAESVSQLRSMDKYSTGSYVAYPAASAHAIPRKGHIAT